MNITPKDKNEKSLSLGDKVRHPYKFGNGEGIVHYSQFCDAWCLKAPRKHDLCFEIPFNECDFGREEA